MQAIAYEEAGSAVRACAPIAPQPLAFERLAKPLIAERFAVRRKLGVGSFGAVYQAIDRERGEAVALKHLMDTRPESVRRFRDELRHVEAVRHPNLAAAYELLRLDGEWLLIMELVRGSALFPHLGVQLDGTGGEAREVARALLGLARGLAAFHAAGRLHRDVKPSNVLVERGTGRVVLVDFGLAIALEDAGRPTRRVAGTPQYMSPEQSCGEALGAASDAYALGVILYETLTGRRPFVGSSGDLSEAKLTAVPRPPSALRDVPPVLDALCTRLLRRIPDDRPAMREVIETLAAFVGVAPEVPACLPIHVPALRRAPELARILAVSNDSAFAVVQSDEHVETIFDPHVVVARGRCRAHERVAYQGLDEVVRDLLDQCPIVPIAGPLRASLDDAFPSVRGESGVRAWPGPVAANLLPALMRIARMAAVGRPLVIWIDDAQWIDAESLALLRAWLGDRRAPRVLFVCVTTGRIDSWELATHRLSMGDDA